MKRNPIMMGLAALLLAGAMSACFSFKGGDETVVRAAGLRLRRRSCGISKPPTTKELSRSGI